MPSTAYKNTGAVLHLSGFTFGMDARVNYDSPTRTNNTVTFKNVSVTVRYTGNGSVFTYNTGWDAVAQILSGTTRASGFWSGTRNVGNTNTSSASGSFNISVSAGATSVNVRAGARFRNDSYTYTSNTAISIPALGKPAGTTTVDDAGVTDTTIGVRNDVTSWGSNATAGSVRSYIADNSSFTGQTYKSTTDNALVTHTGLTPNKKYWFRGWAQNGGGNNNYLGSDTGVTLSNATISSSTILATTAQFVGTAVTGEYEPTTKIQYRTVGSDTWSDSTGDSGADFDITVSGLLPNTEYEYRYAVTTTAGTKFGDTATFTTLPAGKLVYPDGSVKNAITRVIYPDGTKKMVNVNFVEGV